MSDIVNSGCDSLREDADDPEGWEARIAESRISYDQ
jgi:hypothetical protein